MNGAASCCRNRNGEECCHECPTERSRRQARPGDLICEVRALDRQAIVGKADIHLSHTVKITAVEILVWRGLDCAVGRRLFLLRRLGYGKAIDVYADGGNGNRPASVADGHFLEFELLDFDLGRLAGAIG